MKIFRSKKNLTDPKLSNDNVCKNLTYDHCSLTTIKQNIMHKKQIFIPPEESSKPSRVCGLLKRDDITVSRKIKTNILRTKTAIYSVKQIQYIPDHPSDANI